MAFEQQIPVKKTAEDFAETLKNEHKRLLAKYEIEKDPLEMRLVGRPNEMAKDKPWQHLWLYFVKESVLD